MAEQNYSSEEFATRFHAFARLVMEGESAPERVIGNVKIVTVIPGRKPQDEDFTNVLYNRLEKVLGVVPSTDSFKEFVTEGFRTLYAIGLLSKSLEMVANGFGISDVSTLEGFDPSRMSENERTLLQTARMGDVFGLYPGLITKWEREYEARYGMKPYSDENSS